VQKPEILAPAGNWTALETVVKAGADAVYIGGKRFSMRMWRDDLNFSDDEIRRAAEMLHTKQRKLYVTVNNLMWDDELPELAAYLKMLSSAEVDAVIVQDLGVVGLAREMGINLAFHASVQVGLHDLSSLQEMAANGIVRAIVSRDVSLSELHWLAEQSPIQLECFTHGELCAAHTGQCIWSALEFGESSNRGRCLKPCRWKFSLFRLDQTGRKQAMPDSGNYLACKDLCLLPAIPELVHARIASLKIEGRMREAGYLEPLVRAYRMALDAYCQDPWTNALPADEWRRVYSGRFRDFTLGHAFGDPGTALYDYSGLREPTFATRAVEHSVLSAQEVMHPQWRLSKPANESAHRSKAGSTRLGVQVSQKQSALAALEAGADLLYLGGERNYLQSDPISIAVLSELADAAAAKQAKIVVGTPRIASNRVYGELQWLLPRITGPAYEGIMVANWGILRYLRESSKAALLGDFGLNLTNSAAVRFARTCSLQRVTASLEMPFGKLLRFLETSSLPVEVIVHGRLEGMLIRQNLHRLFDFGDTEPSVAFGGGGQLFFEDEAGERYRLEVDQFENTHVLFPQQLCHLPNLSAIVARQAAVVRLNLQDNNPDQVAMIVGIYKKALQRSASDAGDYAVDAEDWRLLEQISPFGYTMGAQSWG